MSLIYGWDGIGWEGSSSLNFRFGGSFKIELGLRLAGLFGVNEVGFRMGLDYFIRIFDYIIILYLKRIIIISAL